jgi:hypothetical protein
MMKQLNISPVLKSHICCPSCFTIYYKPKIPQEFSYKETKQARECGTVLFERNSRSTKVDIGPTQRIPSQYTKKQYLKYKLPHRFT